MRKEDKLRVAGLSLFVMLLLAVVMLAAPAVSPAQVSVGVSVTFAPPALPIYAQPPIPGPGFFWVPGYWAWDPDYGYYWVPGVWVPAPFPGALWTPGYWAWSDGVFIWNEGYWGPVVGFYGGVVYGFGYTGVGYEGGHWRGNSFYYNRTVNNVNVTNITNVYTKTVRNVNPAGASFNGGRGGTTARPTSGQLAVARQKRTSLTDAQKQQMRVARDDPKQRASENQGRPTIAATAKPGEFTGRGVIKATKAGAPYKAPPGPSPRGERPVIKPREKRAVTPEGGPSPRGERPVIKPREKRAIVPEGGPSPRGERPVVKPREKRAVTPEGGPSPRGERPVVKPREKRAVTPEGGPAPREEKKPAEKKKKPGEPEEEQRR